MAEVKNDVPPLQWFKIFAPTYLIFSKKNEPTLQIENTEYSAYIEMTEVLEKVRWLIFQRGNQTWQDACEVANVDTYAVLHFGHRVFDSQKFKQFEFACDEMAGKYLSI